MANLKTFLGQDYDFWFLRDGTNNPDFPGGSSARFNPANYTGTLGCLENGDIQFTHDQVRTVTQCRKNKLLFGSDYTMNVQVLNYNQSTSGEGGAEGYVTQNFYAHFRSEINGTVGSAGHVNRLVHWLLWDNVAGHVRWAGTCKLLTMSPAYPNDEFSAVNLNFENVLGPNSPIIFIQTT